MQILTKRVDNTLPTDKLTRIAKDKTILSFYHDPPSQEIALKNCVDDEEYHNWMIESN